MYCQLELGVNFSEIRIKIRKDFYYKNAFENAWKMAAILSRPHYDKTAEYFYKLLLFLCI